MNKKIICLFICMQFVITAIPTVESLNENEKYSTILEIVENSSLDDWSEMQKLLALDGAGYDNFGVSVSLDGDYALIGADKDDDKGIDSGSAYVFIRNGSFWDQEAKLLASDGAPNDYFGYSVSFDEDTAIIGAYGHDDNGDLSGSAYIFTRTGNIWTQQAKLLASDGAQSDYFGYSVSLSGDTALIGAFRDDDNGYYSGSAYVFIRNGSFWDQEAKLLASDGAEWDNFGYRVFLDGDYALIGAPYDDENGIQSGSAYVFKRTGTTWAQEAKLLASDGQSYDLFGRSVSLNEDYALIGAYGDDDNGADSGSAYVFKRTGIDWTQERKLLASDGTPDDYFGFSVSLDGNYALIGAYRDDDNGDNSGSAYVFNRTGTIWVQEAKLFATDGALGDYFGCSVSLDGNYALIGVYSNDENGKDSGSGYVFTKGNLPPNPPTITGPISGYAGVMYNYLFSTTDPDGDDVSYWINWGDGTYTGWLGPYPSGHNVSASHSWSNPGFYEVNATAKDTHGAQSECSPPFLVEIKPGVVLEIGKISGGFFRVKTVIKNTGTVAASNVHYHIHVEKSLISDTSKIIPSIPAGDEVSVRSLPILGFGSTTVTVNADIPGISAETRVQDGFILLFFIRVKPDGSISI